MTTFLVLLTRDQTKLHQVNMNGDSFALSCKTPAGVNRFGDDVLVLLTRDQTKLHQVNMNGDSFAL